jgi:LacI family transcriptional regulator
VVLSDKREGVRVPDHTRERVRATAKRLGYSPNTLARGLRTRRTSLVGFVSEEVTTKPFAVALLAAVHHEAARRGRLLLMLELGEEPSEDDRSSAVALLHAQHVQAVVYATMYHRRIDLPPGLPHQTVVANAQSAGGQFPSIVPDEEQGAFEATSHLLRHGHQRIAYLDEASHPIASVLRRRGYTAALTAAGIPPDPRLHIEAVPFVRGGLDAGRLLDLSGTERPTAIFCYNDRQAMGVYRAARHRGLVIPRDLSVVGFDDQAYIASELDPPLTTMRLPHELMGTEAVRLLLDGDEGGAPEAGRLRVDSERPWLRLAQVHLVDRQSVAPPLS